METQAKDLYFSDIRKGIALKGKMASYIIAGEKPLGQGMYGTVFEACNAKTKETVALKVVNKKDQDVYKSYLQEKDLLQKINSPYIVKIYDEWELPSTAFIAMEFCNEGTLQKYMIQNQHLNENNALQIIIQILKGLTDMQAQNISHRDLKPENILIHNGNIKLADLGHSKQLKDDKGHKTFVGTPWYMAPEVLKLSEGQFYSEKCDIFAIGIIFFEMLYKRYPYSKKITKNSNQNSLIRSIQENIKDFSGRDLSKQVQDLIENMIQVDENLRYSLHQVKEHPAVTQGFMNYKPKGLEDLINMDVDNIQQEDQQQQQQDFDNSQIDEYDVTNINQILENYTECSNKKRNAISTIKNLLNEINIYNQLGTVVQQMTEFEKNEIYITQEYAHFYGLKKLAHLYKEFKKKIEDPQKITTSKSLREKIAQHPLYIRVKILVSDMLSNIVEAQLESSGMQLQYGVSDVPQEDINEVISKDDYTEKSEEFFKKHMKIYFNKLKESELYRGRNQENGDKPKENVQKHMHTVATIIDMDTFFSLNNSQVKNYQEFQNEIDVMDMEEREKQINDLMQQLQL